jgi:diguanylate cyclase (GGDEF)-like protein
MAVTQKAAADSRALHDDLTGLPNRAIFYQRVREAIGTPKHERVAVLLLDLDQFRDINDSLGQLGGDAVLQEVSDRLRGTAQTADTVARLGGDEFGILLLDPPGGDGTQIGGRLLGALKPPVVLDDVDIEVRASVGVAFFPEHGRDLDTLLKRAGVALRLAKAEAGSSYQVYTPEQDPYSTKRAELMGELRRGLENAELVLHYQPKIDMRTRQVTGAEGLVRWRHPRHGLLLPDKFLPLAEHTGLMKTLTQEVLRMALRQCRTWHEAGLTLNVAVNVATSDLLDEQFPEGLGALLAEQGLAPSWLELEITERTIMANPPQARTALTRLRAMGVRVSVDDFGTGYSSLADLKDLPVDAVKIDRTFVRDMENDANDAAVVRAVIDLGRDLGLQVIAEGVEDEETWNRLAGLGCNLAQGYHLGPPLSAKEFSLWLSHWSELTGGPGKVVAQSRLRPVG